MEKKVVLNKLTLFQCLFFFFWCGYFQPGKWSFNSHTVLKNSEQAPR